MGRVWEEWRLIGWLPVNREGFNRGSDSYIKLASVKLKGKKRGGEKKSSSWSNILLFSSLEECKNQDMFPTEKQFKLNPGLNTVVSKWNYLRFFSSSFSSSFWNSFWRNHSLKIDREFLFRIWIVFEDTRVLRVYLECGHNWKNCFQFSFLGGRGGNCIS